MNKIMIGFALVGVLSLTAFAKESKVIGNRRPAQTANFGKTFSAQSDIIDFGSFGGTVLFLQKDTAKDIFENMTKPVKSSTYDNICTDKSGKMLNVKVEQRTGVAFGCEKWPTVCYGDFFYKCESLINLEDGSLKARQTNN